MERKPTSTRSRDNRTSADSEDIIWLAEKQYATPAASKQRCAITIGDYCLHFPNKVAFGTRLTTRIGQQHSCIMLIWH